MKDAIVAHDVRSTMNLFLTLSKENGSEYSSRVMEYLYDHNVPEIGWDLVEEAMNYVHGELSRPASEACRTFGKHRCIS